MRVYDDNSFSIGRTPLVRLNRVTDGGKSTILAKIEGRNPAYSVKCRIGASMVWDAEKRGILKPGKALIEPTSGNTGIALAFVAAARGYPDHAHHARDHVRWSAARCSRRWERTWCSPTARWAWPAPSPRPKRLLPPTPSVSCCCNSSRIPPIRRFMCATTGPEIWEDTEGAIDVLVSGIGTGGTISGVSRYIKKEKGKKILSVGVEPVTSAVITQHLAGLPMKPGPHKIQGLAPASFPIRWTFPWWIGSSCAAMRKRWKWRGGYARWKEFWRASPAERQ